MHLKLNLAALTSTELERLLGLDATRGVMSELSAAKLIGRTYPYTFVPLEDLEPIGVPLEIENWAGELVELGFAPHPIQLDSGFYRRLFQIPLINETTVVTLNWNGQGSTHLECFSILKEPVAGINAAVTSSEPQVFPLEFSEVISYKCASLPVPQLLEAHQQHVRQFGRPLKQSSPEEATVVLRLVRDLCIKAWMRRGVLVD